MFGFMCQKAIKKRLAETVKFDLAHAGHKANGLDVAWPVTHKFKKRLVRENGVGRHRLFFGNFQTQITQIIEKLLAFPVGEDIVGCGGP